MATGAALRILCAGFTIETLSALPQSYSTGVATSKYTLTVIAKVEGRALSVKTTHVSRAVITAPATTLPECIAVLIAAVTTVAGRIPGEALFTRLAEVQAHLAGVETILVGIDTGGVIGAFIVIKTAVSSERLTLSLVTHRYLRIVAFEAHRSGTVGIALLRWRWQRIAGSPGDDAILVRELVNVNCRSTDDDAALYFVWYSTTTAHQIERQDAVLIPFT